MKIKKHGKMFEKEPPIPVEKFVCNSCGCEFTCKNDEYYVDFGGANSSCSPFSISTTSTYYAYRTTIKDYLICSCPECHKIVKKIRERKSDGITVPSYNINLNSKISGTNSATTATRKDTYDTYTTITGSAKDLEAL